MNRAPALARLSRTLLRQHQQVRHGGGGPVVVGPRWSEIVRGESNIVTADDPPTAPLSDDHEVGEGDSDFANYYDNHDDLSTMQIVTGLGGGLLFCYGLYRISQTSLVRIDPTFTARETPFTQVDMPTTDHTILRGAAKQEAINRAAEEAKSK